MKAIMITGPSSGQGKTTFTMGLCRVLKNKNYDIAPFKTGPDYIDPKFHSYAAGHNAGNLDLHLQGESGIKKALSLNKADFAIVEGAMGYFDGIDNGYEGSSFDISKRLNIPAIMIITPGAEMFSLIPKLMGMSEFAKGQIKGIILNKVKDSYYNKIKSQIERYTGLKTLGFIEKNNEFEIASRHLGLLRPSEIDNLDDSLNKIANIIEKNIDLNSLLEIPEEIQVNDLNFNKTNKKVLIARDEAFCFHYNENLRILERIADLNYFSPINDIDFPDSDLIIIGGGYPELYLKELSENLKMRNKLKDFSKSGGRILGMGAGLMYLSESIDGYDMVGAVPGKIMMTEKTQRFGYNIIDIEKDCLLGEKGSRIKAKEFHKSIFETDLNSIFKVEKIDGRSWRCGYNIKNTLVMYQHINFAGEIDLAKILDLEDNYVY